MLVVGRRTELAAIDALLDGTRLPAALVLEGEAGIGKTTLLRAGVERARARGHRVLAARPASTESELPFAGLADLLGPCVGELRGVLPAPQARALETALLLVEHGTAARPHLIGAAVLSSLRALAAKTPVLVAVDDVQWLDRPSATALEFAARRLAADLPVALLLGWRTEGEQPPPLGLGTALELSLRRVLVGPLSLGALHRLVTERLGHPLPRPTLVRIEEASRGNPFFALELAAAVEQRGSGTSADELALPATLADALEQRLAALPEASRDALLAVALLGSPTLEVVDRALGEGAATVLEPAVSAGVIAFEHGRVRFTHPLMRSAVETGAWPNRRREWHRRLGQIVPDEDERVRHVALALDGYDEDVAATLESAAHRARVRGAIDVAATLAERAWRGTPPEQGETAWRRGYLAAEYDLQAGDLDRAAVSLGELLSSARSGDERSLANALQSLIEHRVNGPSASFHRLELALAEAESVEQRQSVESDFASLLAITGDVEGAAAHAREALALADEIGERATIADALALVAATEQVLGRGLRRDLLERADAIAALRDTDSITETTGVLRNVFNWAAVLAAADEFDDARARFDAADRLIERQGLAQLVPELERGRADLECWAGSWDAAARSVERCEEYAEQTGQLSKLEDVAYARAFVAAHRGDLDGARAVSRDALARTERSGNRRGQLRHLAVLGFAALSEGDAAEAAVQLERARAVARETGFMEPGRSRFHGDLIEALVAVGRLDDADAATGELERSGAVTVYPWARAVGARCRALVCAERHDVDGAFAALSASHDAHDELRNPFERGRTLLVFGVVARRAKRRAEAREALDDARRAFEACGARRWAERAVAELQRIPGRRSSDRDELTAAERRIADLVAEGRSNKEVAATLFVTVKTVETALTRIYRKLGVRSRTELAHHLSGPKH